MIHPSASPFSGHLAPARTFSSSHIPLWPPASPLPSGAPGLQPSSSSLGCPAVVSGVTGMQASTANEMSGGLLEPTGDVASGLSDGASAARRGAGTTASAADSLRGLSRTGGRLLGPLSVGLDAVGGGLKIREAWNDRSLTDRQRDERVGQATVGTVGSVVGGAGGAWAGAAAGAAIGSAVPVVGTLVGGVVGAVLGGFLGGRAGEKAGEAAGRTSVGRAVGHSINTVAGK